MALTLQIGVPRNLLQRVLCLAQEGTEGVGLVPRNLGGSGQNGGETSARGNSQVRDSPQTEVGKEP